MPRDETALHGTGASCQSGGWKYLEKHLLSCRLWDDREERAEEKGEWFAAGFAKGSPCCSGDDSFRFSLVGCSGFLFLGLFPKLWVATTENLSFRKNLVSASGKLQHGIPLRCYLCSSPAEKLCWFGLGFGQQGQAGVKVWPSQGCTDVCTLTRNGVYMPEFIYYLPGTVSYSTVTPVAKSTDRLLLGHYLYHIQMHQS